MNIKHDKGNKKRVLLTGGRAPVALDLARKLAISGHTVYIAESCPAQLCKRSRFVSGNMIIPKPKQDPVAFIHSLQEIIRTKEIDWLIPTCEEIFYVSQQLSELEKYCSVFVDSIDKLHRYHNKWRFIQTSKQLNLQVPETYLLRSEEEIHEVFSAEGKWVYKRVYSRFATNVYIVDHDDWTVRSPKRMSVKRLKKELYKEINKKQLWIAQRFIEGHGFCSYAICHDGEVHAMSTYPVEFTAGAGACISFEAIHHEKIEKWLVTFVRNEQFTGQIAFDFFVTNDDNIFAIECNPRTTSGIHLFTDAHLFSQALFNENDHEMIRPSEKEKAVISVAMLSYGLMSLRSIKDLKRWLQFMCKGKDIIFRLDDLWPFLQQFPLLLWSAKVSRKERISLMQATTFDIEWNGEEE